MFSNTFETKTGRILNRPARENVKTQGLFFKASEFERRVIGMMINEIGVDRYKELIEIANGDMNTPDGYAPSRAMYYADPDKDMINFIPQRILIANKEQKIRMEAYKKEQSFNRTNVIMRSNRNDFASKKL